jgi:mannose-1-phosphate guanylyltransferase
LFPIDRILVVTNAAYAADLHRQVPALLDENFLLEPAPRGTAPAIALSALHVRRRDPAGVLACLTADHYIGDQARFRAVLRAAAQVAQRGYLVTLGIAPSFPSTGYGYIQRGERLGVFDGFEAFQAVRFKEKPALAEAEALVADGLHSWNSGMFVWRADRILAEFARQMPGFYKLLLKVEADPARVEQHWGGAPNTTIDYGIMEGAEEVAVIPAEGLDWNDIGSWESLLEVLPPDASGNIVIGGEHIGIETTGTLIHADDGKRLVATIGLSNVVIVDTGDVLLVCPRERSQEVRELVERLKQTMGGERYL